MGEIISLDDYTTLPGNLKSGATRSISLHLDSATSTDTIYYK